MRPRRARNVYITARPLGGGGPAEEGGGRAVEGGRRRAVRAVVHSSLKVSMAAAAAAAARPVASATLIERPQTPKCASGAAEQTVISPGPAMRVKFSPL